MNSLIDPTRPMGQREQMLLGRIAILVIICITYSVTSFVWPGSPAVQRLVRRGYDEERVCKFLGINFLLIPVLCIPLFIDIFTEGFGLRFLTFGLLAAQLIICIIYVRRGGLD